MTNGSDVLLELIHVVQTVLLAWLALAYRRSQARPRRRTPTATKKPGHIE